MQILTLANTVLWISYSFSGRQEAMNVLRMVERGEFWGLVFLLAFVRVQSPGLVLRFGERIEAFFLALQSRRISLHSSVYRTQLVISGIVEHPLFLRLQNGFPTLFKQILTKLIPIFSCSQLMYSGLSIMWTIGAFLFFFCFGGGEGVLRNSHFRWVS